MKIICPKCGNEHNVNLKKINYARFKALCSSCKTAFLVSIDTCPACGNLQLSGQKNCKSCQAPFESFEKLITQEANKEVTREKKNLDKNTESADPIRYKPEFLGSGAEYFRIWIVNLALTILSLGIYAPWAKVRTQQYFYLHSQVAGQPFEYLANPVAILKGYLIVGACLVVYNLTNTINPVIGAILVPVFMVIFPFLMYKSLRFKAHNSAYRNIRFRFLGTLGESYITFLLLPILTPLTLGLALPYGLFRQKYYVMGNFVYGSSKNIFTGQIGKFYLISLMTALIALAAIIPFAIPLHWFAENILPALRKSAQPSQQTTMMLVGAAVIVYFFALFLFSLVQQYYYARTTNYCWSQLNMGGVQFQSTLKARQLIWIRFSNILGIILSLGLFMPWAKVRRTRYLLDNITVITPRNLDKFIAAKEDDESAVGDAAMDYFDFEIGL
ncbi:MAG: DUF898 family protein [Desulfobulbaceae bacterium]|nr:DUF898 family protein [Desulfobulbaceae bacterium]